MGLITYILFLWILSELNAPLWCYLLAWGSFIFRFIAWTHESEERFWHVVNCRNHMSRRREIDVGRSYDTGGLADDTIHNSSLDSQPLICSHPCMDSTCKHHPIAAPVDGTMCEYIDLFMTEGCVRKDD